MRVLKFLCLLALVVTAGCASPPPDTVAVPNLPQAMPVDPPGGSYMLTANTYAGDALHKMLLLRMSSGSGILTTSFVNLHDFEETSALGRIASQQVGSRLGQYGFRVLESRIAVDLTMERRTGEFMLTRDACKLLADTYDANAVLVGCYSDTGSSVYVSVRVVRLSDNAIMGAYEYYLPRDGDITRLLAGTGSTAAGADGVWGMYGNRTPAFTGRNARAAVAGSGAGYRPVMSGAVQKDTPYNAGAGRAVDPAAAQTPYPAKQKKR